MTPTEDFLCFKCKHANMLGDGCAAFDNIPVHKIATKGHSKVYKGQKAPVIFEPGEPSFD